MFCPVVYGKIVKYLVYKNATKGQSTQFTTNTPVLYSIYSIYVWPQKKNDANNQKTLQTIFICHLCGFKTSKYFVLHNTEDSKVLALKQKHLE